MIAVETIQELTRKYQTGADNVWREYFQHLFLSYFYQQKHTEKIYLKGGTALRLLYQSPRFSEDLDFSSSLRETTNIEAAVLSTIDEIAREGVNADIVSAKTTTGGYLVALTFPAGDDSIPIRLEMSLREGRKKGDFTTISSDFLPPYSVVQLTEEQLVKEKITAFLSRQKPRDFYDAYFLLRSRMIPGKSTELLKGMLDVVEHTSIRFESELKRFLPKNHWMIIKDLKAALEREIARYI